MRFAIMLLLALGLASGSGYAHEDPVGEVGAELVVDGGGFVLTSIDNTLESYTVERVITRRLKRDGSMDGAPKVEDMPLDRHKVTRFPKLPDEYAGLERETKDGWIVVPPNSFSHLGRPSIIRVDGRKLTLQKLGWKQSNVDLVEDVLADGDSLYFLVSRETLDPSVFSLWLHRFSLQTGKEIASVRLPDPEAIYNLPRCSNLVSVDGVIYVALIPAGLRVCELRLCSWNGIATKPREQVLTKDIDGNTSLTMAHLDRDLVIAYHQGPAGTVAPFDWHTEWANAKGIPPSQRSFFDAWREPKSKIKVLHRVLDAP